MDARERTQAANALIEWFNSQEIPPHDAAVIMTKVTAKIIVGAIHGAHTHDQRTQINDAVDDITLQLVHEINDRIFHVRRRS
jgi:hypothetical protein